MRMGKPVDALYAREPRQILKLVDRGRIERERTFPKFTGKLPREHTSKLRRMLGAVHACRSIVRKFLVYLNESSRLGADAAAASRERIDRLGGRAVLLERIKYHSIPEWHLIIDMSKSQQYHGFMKYAFFK
jgi:hypothetical protein